MHISDPLLLLLVLVTIVIYGIYINYYKDSDRLLYDDSSRWMSTKYDFAHKLAEVNREHDIIYWQKGIIHEPQSKFGPVRL